ncbi:MAG: SLC13 family permease, partial [Sulfuriferula sp.]
SNSGQEKFGLFSVTPLGLALLGSGIAYFAFFGRWVLPNTAGNVNKNNKQAELVQTLNLPTTLYAVQVVETSKLVGKTQEELAMLKQYGLYLVSLCNQDKTLDSPWLHTHFTAGQILGLLGNSQNVDQLCQDMGLTRLAQHACIEPMADPIKYGFAELVVGSRSPDIDKSLYEVMRERALHVTPVMVYAHGESIRSDLLERRLQSGDAIIVHGRLEDLRAMGRDDAFLLATSIEVDEVDEKQGWKALSCFVGAIVLALSGIQLSLALMSGALAMVLLRVIKIDEAYKAVDWRTVFLLAGLIPLGIAMDKTGAAALVADQMMTALAGSSVLVILLAVAVLTTLFSLFMSNVAATVLLVPLVTHIGLSSNIDPRALALLVGVAASNSFILPTHQVNALLMGPGGYRNADYLKAGGIMTVLFIIISVGFIYTIYL